MEKIDKSEFLEFKKKFGKYITKYPTVNAVITGVQDGYVYSNKSRNNLFVSAKFGWSMLIADKDTGECFEFLKQNSFIPDYIHLLPPNEEVIKYILSNWPKYKIRERCQLQFLKDLSYRKSIPDLPLGISIKDIKHVEFSSLEKFGFDFANRYWNSKENFINNAIGVCVLDKSNEPIAICYSICVVDGFAELEIFVMPEYQGMGIGKVVAEYYVNMCIERGVIPHWDTFTENTPSFQLAKSIGFKEISKYNMISTFLRNW